MKRIIFIFTIFISQFSLGNTTMEVEEIFEHELKSRGVTYTKAEDQVYDVETIDGLKRISIQNLQQNYLRDGDPDLVKQFVDNILQPISGQLSWSQLEAGIYPSLEPSDYDGLNEIIHENLSDTTVVILAYYDSDVNQIRFLIDADLKSAGVDVSVAWKQAYSNIDKIMSETEISFTDIDGQLLALVEAHEPHKASLILSSKLKSRVSEKLGWPIYAVSPARDFVYLFSKDSGLINRVGPVVAKEFKNSGYPISTEVWEISDSKPMAIGAYPTE